MSQNGYESADHNCNYYGADTDDLRGNLLQVQITVGSLELGIL